MVQDTIFTKQRLINLSIIITAIWFTWFAQNFFDEYTVRIINNVAIFIILAVSYNLINGVTGQFSLEYKNLRFVLDLTEGTTAKLYRMKQKAA